MHPKILVTGANGYTGGQFCRYLNDKGIAVRGMYWEPDGVPDCSLEHVEFVPGDLRDRDSLKRALDGIEIVHNIAALYRPTNVSNKMYWETNVEGVRNIIELASDVGVKRFVQCSTIGVHGHIVEPPATESAPIKPDDYYQYTKWKGEELALELSKKLRLSLIVIRPAAIYGSLESRFLKMAKFMRDPPDPVQLITRDQFIYRNANAYLSRYEFKRYISIVPPCPCGKAVSQIKPIPGHDREHIHSKPQQRKSQSRLFVHAH